MADPFEILLLTPRTNCGACGYPACLAFAAAVARAGEDPGKCPDFKGGFKVAPETKVAGPDLALPDERDLSLVRHLQGKISDAEFAAIAVKLGANWDEAQPDFLVFPYLGSEVRLGKKTVLLAGGAVIDPRDQILLYNYIHSHGGRPLSGEWIGLESLPNSISKVRTLAVYCEDRLAQVFDRQSTESIMEALGQLGAIAGPTDLAGTASIAAIVPVLPMLPQFLLYWEAEPADGFAARVKVLFDRQVLDFLDLESLVFSAERMADRLGELLA